MMNAASVVLLIGALCAWPQHASGQLFELDTGVSLTPVGYLDTPYGVVLGQDGDGFIVSSTGDTSFPVDCKPTSTPGQPTQNPTPFYGAAQPSLSPKAYGFHEALGVIEALVSDALYLKIIRCADVPLAPPAGWSAPLHSGAPIPIDFEGRPIEPLRGGPFGLSGRAMVWPERVCLALHDGVWCVDLGDPQPALRRHLTVDALVAQVDIDPGFLTQQKGAGLGADYTIPTLQWRFRALTALPQGRVAALVHSVAHENLAGQFAMLLLIDEHGQVVRLLHGLNAWWSFQDQDIEGLNRRTPLRDVDRLHYDATLDAVLAYPVHSWEWSGAWPAHSTSDGSPIGWYGLGALAVSVTEPGTGYLSFSDAIARSGYQLPSGGPIGGGLYDAVPRIEAMGPLGAGDFMVSLEYGHSEGNAFRLAIDHDALDLDRDGMSRAQEAALGTSDWRWDSDGDGLEDTYEHRILGQSPTVRHGDSEAQAHFDRVPVAFSQSLMLSAWRIPALAGSPASGGANNTPLSEGIEGPLCSRGRCWDHHGHEVYRGDGVRSVDGRVIATWGTAAGEEDVLFGEDLTTGERWRWVDPEALRRLLPSETALMWSGIYPESRGSLLAVIWTFDPIRGELTWVIRADGQGSLTTVFDLQQERCDSGLGPCDPIGAMNANNDNLLDHHDLPGPWYPIGYHLESARVLLGVRGVWEGYLVGVHATEPPEVLLRSMSLARQNRHQHQTSVFTPWAALLGPKLFPSALKPTGFGEYLSDQWLYDAHLNDGPMSSVFYIGPPYDAQGLVGAWGDTLFQAGTGREVVRIERQVEPGDVLGLGRSGQRDLYGYETSGVMLYKLGVRGGIAQLWDAPRLPGVWPTGMDVSAGGRLCVADGLHRRLVEVSPAEEDRIPTLTSIDREGVDVIDCFYEDDDTLLLLMTDPPRVERLRRGPHQALELVETLTGKPGLFVREQGSDYSILDAEGDLRGALRLQDGTRLTLRTGDAHPIYHAADAQLVYSDYGERYELVERPDGVVAALAVQPLGVYDHTIADRTHPHPSLYHRGLHHAIPGAVLSVTVGEHAWFTLARVPGGVGRDPWTGEALGPEGWAGAETEDSPAMPDPPRPERPTGGEPVPSTAGGEPGCRQAPGPAGARWGLGVAMLLGWAAWRRGARSRHG